MSEHVANGDPSGFWACQSAAIVVVFVVAVCNCALFAQQAEQVERVCVCVEYPISQLGVFAFIINTGYLPVVPDVTCC